MPPEYAPGSPGDWLSRAKGDLAIAQHGISIPGVHLEDLCFHAQQAAEKALKGLAIAAGVRFPYTHDLVLLLSLLEQRGCVPPDHVRDAGRLNPYAVLTRYPYLAEPVLSEAYSEAVRIARDVLLWVEQQLAARNTEF